MHFNSLSSLESTIAKTGNNGEYELRQFSIPVPGEDLMLNGILTSPKKRSQYYYAVAHPKERIVLHFTAGHIRSDLGALTRHNYHVSVAFVVGRSGAIYQLFPSKFWSGHIGKGIGNSGNAQDKVTIGIELSNYGFLTERNGNLETYYSRMKDNKGNIGPADVYCSLADKDAYHKTNTPFRQQSYYATYTNAQYDSLIILLRYLTVKYNIPRKFMPEATRYEATTDVLSFKGIVSHINYRTDGKWDIGPGFDWNKVTSGVQAASYTAQFNSIEQAEMRGGLDTTRGSLHSESEMEDYIPVGKDATEEEAPYDDEKPVPIPEEEETQP